MAIDTTDMPVLLQMRPVHMAGSGGTSTFHGTRMVESESALVQEIRHQITAGAGFREPLLMFAASRRRTVGLLKAGADFPLHKISLFANVCLVLPGADGPVAWGQLPQLLRWAHRVVLYDRKPDPEHYRQFAEITGRVSKLLLIETTPRHRADWLAAAAGHTAEPVNELGPLPAQLIAAAVPAIA
ncbi:hypothetical protein BKE38_22375 [Pseudoroseomonas deserti]|uniref:Uncharacterized protein n=1 Tax=Teichococcus deserti TaxID=1817963 RepID=A0A1V2GXA3_9PROT|nr:hypothetical protein [Pseudoroseomonas deserti]ONG47967.1 hypothetical protein BKE38_22375 [Pseudoroseomonas deserti]